MSLVVEDLVLLKETLVVSNLILMLLLEVVEEELV